MMNRRFGIQAGLAALVFALTGCAGMGNSHSIALGGTLTGTNEVPPTTSAATGMVEAVLDKDSNLLKWKVTYSGLTGPAFAAHFHGPALAGQNSGIVLPFQGSLDSPIDGQATLTAEQVADLLAGKWYVNLHTKAFPRGEVRAQVLPK